MRNDLTELEMKIITEKSLFLFSAQINEPDSIIIICMFLELKVRYSRCRRFYIFAGVPREYMYCKVLSPDHMLHSKLILALGHASRYTVDQFFSGFSSHDYRSYVTNVLYCYCVVVQVRLIRLKIPVETSYQYNINEFLLDQKIELKSTPITNLKILLRSDWGFVSRNESQKRSNWRKRAAKLGESRIRFVSGSNRYSILFIDHPEKVSNRA